MKKSGVDNVGNVWYSAHMRKECPLRLSAVNAGSWDSAQMVTVEVRSIHWIPGPGALQIILY